MPELREQAAVLALAAATEKEWHRTASRIEQVGSALRIVGGDWSVAELPEGRNQ